MLPRTTLWVAGFNSDFGLKGFHFELNSNVHFQQKWGDQLIDPLLIYFVIGILKLQYPSTFLLLL